jgi:hypothetical protein
MYEVRPRTMLALHTGTSGAISVVKRVMSITILVMSITTPIFMLQAACRVLHLEASLAQLA